MQKKSVLISAVCGDIGCSSVRSISKAGYKIIGYDIESYSPVSTLLEKQYQVPAAFYTEEYIAAIKEILKKENIDFFLPISESEIEVLKHMKVEIEAVGVKILLNNELILDNFLDKLKTIKYLENIGIKIPKTMPLAAYDGSMEYPLIIKSVKGHGSKKLWKIENSLDLDYFKHKDDGSLIIQELIGNEDGDYTTGVFSDGKTVSSITFKRKLGYGGLSIEAIFVDEPFLDELSQRVGRETGLIGSINIQSRRLGDIFIPYEINPRLSSTLLFRKKFGFDDAVWWLEVLDGKSYTYRKKYKFGRAIRGLSEHYFDLRI